MRIDKYLLCLLLLSAQISFAMDQNLLPKKIRIKIARFSGPNGRTALWSINKQWRNFINEMQKPTTDGGCGLIDMLPIMPFTVEFIGERLTEVKLESQRYFLSQLQVRELWLEEKDKMPRHIPLRGDLRHLIADEENVYVADTEGSVYLIDIKSGELLETIYVGFKVGFFISVAPNLVYIVSSNSLKNEDLCIIDYTNKKLHRISLGYDPMPFARYGNYIIGRNCNEPVESRPYTWHPRPRSMFIIDRSTHELVLEIEGKFEYPWSTLGKTLMYPNPSGHLPEDNR